MQIEWQALSAILGMAAVTYMTRVGGFWLIGRFTLSHRVEIWLRYVPGSVLVAIVAPAVLNSGPAGTVAAVASVVVAARTKSLPLAMVAGVLVLLGLRFIF